jgi:formate dehydrogenase major subunit
MQVTRRQFLKVTAAGLGSSSLTLLGFSPEPALAEIRNFKLARTSETRNTCPYCSVSCGVLIYTLGDKSKNAKAEIIHIEGDPDNPVNRGTLCPKGAGLLDMIHSAGRLKHPEVREAGTNQWQRISWDDALNRIARHLKTDRDANFIKTNPDGVTVNRWNTTGFLASSAAGNEAGYLTHKVLRGLGLVTLDTQARI